MSEQQTPPVPVPHIKDLPPTPPFWLYRNLCYYCGATNLYLLIPKIENPPPTVMADCLSCGATVFLPLEG